MKLLCTLLFCIQVVQLDAVKILEWDSEVIAQRDDVVRDPDFFEIFAGSYALTQVAKDQGLNAVGYDRKSNPLLEDFLGTTGFQNCINKVLRLKERALCTLAPECSWWIFFVVLLPRKKSKMEQG